MKSRFLARLFACGVANIVLSALSLAVFAGSARATSLVANGNFEQLLVPGVSSEFGALYSSQQVSNWTTDGYNYAFTPGSADTSGAVGQYGKLYLWGPNNGSANGLPATSPAGGNFLALDGAYDIGAVSQTINGLTPGQAVTVSFYWAGAQQSGYTGATTEQFKVSLGSESKYTPVLDNVSQGFTGWQYESFTFVPTSTSEVLAFLAAGTPGGVPPFSLLDGVSLVAAPEPATWALLLVAGCLSLAVFAYTRRKSSNAASRTDQA